MSDVVEAVAKAICKSKTCEGFMCCQWPAQGGRQHDCPVSKGYYDDAARAAIEAYEAAKREEAHTVFGDVDKAVTEASAAIPGLMRGLAR